MALARIHVRVHLGWQYQVSTAVVAAIAAAPKAPIGSQVLEDVIFKAAVRNDLNFLGACGRWVCGEFCPRTCDSGGGLLSKGCKEERKKVALDKRALEERVARAKKEKEDLKAKKVAKAAKQAEEKRAKHDEQHAKRARKQAAENDKQAALTAKKEEEDRIRCILVWV